MTEPLLACFQEWEQSSPSNLASASCHSAALGEACLCWTLGGVPALVLHLGVSMGTNNFISEGSALLRRVEMEL